jgi:hypothetical protein
MWYVLLPKLTFRNPGKSSMKITEIITMRCTAFLCGDCRALLNKWETDRRKAFLRPVRKRKPEVEGARLRRAKDGFIAVINRSIPGRAPSRYPSLSRVPSGHSAVAAKQQPAVKSLLRNEAQNICANDYHRNGAVY